MTDAPPNADQWIPTGKAAQLLGVSRKTLIRLERLGELHPRRLPSEAGPGNRQYLRREVEDLSSRFADQSATAAG